MTTNNNITNSTVTINNYSSTYHAHEPKGSRSTKACNKCHQIKQLTDFGKDKSKYDGYRNQCKHCHNNNEEEYYKQNKLKLVSIRKNIVNKIKMQYQYIIKNIMRKIKIKYLIIINNTMYKIKIKY